MVPAPVSRLAGATLGRVMQAGDLVLNRDHVREMVAHARACTPNEACGLLLGSADGRVARFVPMANASSSPVVYSLDAREHLRVEIAAESEGLEVIGVMHSHTHSEPYPSTTDVAQAPDPGWHYVIVSLKRGGAETRSYLIRDGIVSEENIAFG